MLLLKHPTYHYICSDFFAYYSIYRYSFTRMRAPSFLSSALPPWLLRHSHDLKIRKSSKTRAPRERHFIIPRTKNSSRSWYKTLVVTGARRFSLEMAICTNYNWENIKLSSSSLPPSRILKRKRCLNSFRKCNKYRASSAHLCGIRAKSTS